MAAEDDAAALGSGLEAGDPQALGALTQLRLAQQGLHRGGQQPEAVDHLHLQLLEGGLVLGAGDALVHHQALLHVGQVVARDQCRQVEADLDALVQRRLDVGRLAGADGRHGAVEHLHVEPVADRLHLPALLLAEQLAGAADLHVVAGQGEAGAKVLGGTDRLEALDGVAGHRLGWRRQQVGVGLVVAAPDAAAQLVELGEAELVGALDQDGVGAGHVDAGLDDGRAHQHVEALVVEVRHHPFQGAFRQLAMGDPDPRLGDQLTHRLGGGLDGLDLVVQEVDLAAAQDLAQDRLLDHRFVAALHEGLHRQPPRRRGGDDGEVADPAHRHVQRARDRRGGHGEDVYLGTQALQALLLGHPEAVLLVDDQQPHPGQLHRLGEQLVGADDDVRLALLDTLERGGLPLAGGEARDELDVHGGVGEAVAEVLVVLAGEQGGGHQHHHLAAGVYGEEGGAHGHLGLAEADVAAHHAVHGPRGGHVADHRADGGALVRRLLEGEGGGEAGVVGVRRGAGEALAGLAAGVDVEQLGGGVADLLGGLPAGLLPLVGAEPVQGGELVVGAGVARDQVQALHRHVELGAVGVLQGHELGGLAAGLQGLEPPVTPHAVGLVDHRGPGLELREVADGQLVGVGGLLAAPALAHHLAVELRLADHRQRRLREPQAGGELALGDGDARLAGEEVSEVLDVGHAQPERRQGLLQRLAPPAGLGHEQHPGLGVLLEEARQRRQGLLGPGIDRHLRRGLGGRCQGVAPGVVGGQLHPRVALDGGEHLGHRHEGAMGRQQRPGGVDAEVLEAALDRPPMVLGGLEDARQQRHPGPLGDVLEEGGGLFEEQRQVLLEAGGGDALEGVHVERALARVDVEQRLEALAEAGDGGARQRVLVGRQQLDALDPIGAALGVRVEGAQGVDLVVEQVDAQRGLHPHGEEIDDGAAQGVLAGLEDRLYCPVAGTRERVAEGLAVQALAHLQGHHPPGDVVHRGQALHQGVDRHQHDAVLAVLQPAQGAQPGGDDVLVGREAVVG